MTGQYPPLGGEKPVRRARAGFFYRRPLSPIEWPIPAGVIGRDAGHVDVKRIAATTTLRESIAGMVNYDPWWLTWLYRLREAGPNITE